MSSPPMGGHSRIEYGVILDNTDVGLGYPLVEVCRTSKEADILADQYRSHRGPHRPVEVKARQVYVTDWQQIATAAPQPEATRPEPNDEQGDAA